MVTSTRADWGLLSPVARALQARADVELQVVATNMHLESKYGSTWREIEADGVAIAAKVPMRGADATGRAGMCLRGMGKVFERLRPDVAVILGDRYEMLAAATAATIAAIPIAHLYGGETTLGAIDDRIRHAITKLSTLHFTATEPYRQRVIAMGEEPGRVYNVGALGVYNALNVAPMERGELEEQLQLRLSRRTVLFTYHPATLSQTAPLTLFGRVLEGMEMLLERQRDVNVLCTYPNNDPGSEGFIAALEAFAKRHEGRVVVVRSLGHRRYLSVLRHIGAVAGNSSSGIIEVPSLHIPTLDIGERQKGRLRAASVAHCAEEPGAVAEAMERLLTPEGLALGQCENPYYQPDPVGTIVEALCQAPLDI